MVFVSIGLRARVEVEALNMVEALGAYTRHRTVSVMKRLSRDGKLGYKLMVVPAVSGQSIANGYHRAVVELAKLAKLPVCNECLNYEIRGGFDKRSTEKILHDDRITTCVVEDLTGFLAPEANVRRTSPVSFSYLVPDVESAKAALDSQFHVKYNFEKAAHAPFNIESGTAIYMMTIAMDVDKIGRLSTGGYVENRCKRIEIALKALEVLIEGFTYGAKKSRYLPLTEILGGIAAISHPIPFVVSAPRIYRDGDNYISETLNRARAYLNALKKFNEDIKLVLFDKEKLPRPNTTDLSVIEVETFGDLINRVFEVVNSSVCRV
ncbi:MAG: DevR family CRISPR-associated autoregulator [Desulfurococcaceae archaeon]